MVQGRDVDGLPVGKPFGRACSGQGDQNELVLIGELGIHLVDAIITAPYVFEILGEIPVVFLCQQLIQLALGLDDIKGGSGPFYLLGKSSEGAGSLCPKVAFSPDLQVELLFAAENKKGIDLQGIGKIGNVGVRPVSFASGLDLEKPDYYLFSRGPGKGFVFIQAEGRRCLHTRAVGDDLRALQRSDLSDFDVLEEYLLSERDDLALQIVSSLSERRQNNRRRGVRQKDGDGQGKDWNTNLQGFFVGW